jgi:hypothetical protein
LFLQLLSRGNTNMLALLAMVTQVRESAAAVEVTRIAAMLAAKTSAREASAVWDTAALHVKDAVDRATLAEREALERMSRAKPENAMMLASAHEDAKGLVRKIALLEGELAAERQAGEVSEREHREKFEEHTLL